MIWVRTRKLWQAIPCYEKRMTWSTVLTLVRIVLTPIIVIARLYGFWSCAFFLFICAAVTDFLDGWLARLLSEQTLLGSCLDPVADKILIVACFAAFSLHDDAVLLVPVWFVVTILLKELVLCIGAACVYVHTGHIEIKPTILGKTTTAIQLLVIGWLFACHFFVWMPTRTYTFVIALLFCMVGITLVQYGQIGFRLWVKRDYV